MWPVAPWSMSQLTPKSKMLRRARVCRCCATTFDLNTVYNDGTADRLGQAHLRPQFALHPYTLFSRTAGLIHETHQ
jgi:hypothetical protein